MSKIQFQDSWIDDFPWLRRGHKEGFAACILCKKTKIYYASMGRSSLNSHCKGKKHKENASNSRKTCPIKTFFTDTSTSAKPSIQVSQSSAVPVQSQASTSSCINPPVSEMVIQPPSSSAILTAADKSDVAPIRSTQDKWWKAKDTVTESEVLWCLQTVMCHNSLRNAESSAKLFKKMFKDSSVANEIKLGKTKISYSIVYGLAPYFKNKLVTSIKTSDFFVLCFDESMNKFAQKQQLDIHIRYWDESLTQVSSKYFGSVFLNHTTAVDVLEALKYGIKDLDFKNIVQLSMDGPNVNLKVLRLLEKEISEGGNHEMLHIGSCGLHVVNVAFKTGIKKTTWTLLSFFRSSYYLFHNSPARRGIYIAVNNTSLFPQKFCSVRWVENVSVAKRALDTLENMKKFVEHVTKNNLKQITNANSFKVVAGALEDKLLRPKIAFFLSLAEDLEPFLKEFQSDSPMAPFLHGNLLNVLKKCMGRIVKEEVLSKTPIQKVEMKKENLIRAQEIDIGYGTKSELRKSHGLKDAEVLQFRKECKLCLGSVIEKLLEKCPLKYKLAESLTFLNPYKVAFSQEEAIKQMTVTMEILVNSNLVSASLAQNADREYRDLVAHERTMLEMKTYTRETRLDVFWMKQMPTHNTKNLKQIVSLLLPLSHGNASVERGFSVNGDIVVENLKEESIVAQRLVYDSVLTDGGVEEFVVKKELLLSMRNANAKYKEALENHHQKLSHEEHAKAEKRKASLLVKQLEEEKEQVILESQKVVASLEEKIKSFKKQKL